MARRSSPLLPNNVGALWLACQCFGLQTKDIKGVSRMAISRAVRGRASTQLNTKVENELWERLLERFRRHKIAPTGTTNSFTDELVMALLQVYRRIRPRLKVTRGSRVATLRAIIEDAFVPTIFMVMVSFQGRGLGSEFFGPQSWYLPRPDFTPFQAVFDRWLRTAGLRTSYGVSRSIRTRNASIASNGEAAGNKRDALRRRLLRWLEGKIIPSPYDVDQLVDDFSAEVEWLDGASAWKARLRLALAVQRACGEIRMLFPDIFYLTGAFNRINSEGIVCDDGRVLAKSDTFFAARLLQLRLQREGKFDKIIAPHRRPPPGMAPDPSDAEIERASAEFRRNANPGNWFLAFVEREARRKGRLNSRRPAMLAVWALEDFIFDLGVVELSRRVRKGPAR